MFNASNLYGERKYGTSRTEELLRLCGNPDEKLKIIHIAGTNGKGSVAAFVSSILKEAGKRAGTFSSPAVYSYEEQFRLDCTPVCYKKLSGYIDEIKALSAQMEDKPCPFEIETAAALYCFYKEGCEYAVMECGLGGRDDATNAVKNKELAIITSVALEHTRELGNTITQICKVKSGIKNNCPLIVSALQSEEGIKYFQSIGAFFAGEGIKLTCGGFIYKEKQYEINLEGSAQCYNAATAIEACSRLGIEENAIFEGIKNARILGRCEKIYKRGRLYILDGAHNPAAFAPLVECIKSLSGSKTLVFGCLEDKDVCGIASIISPYFSSALLLSPDNSRGMEQTRIQSAFKDKIKCETAPSVENALCRAQGDVVAVCGTFTILKEAKEWIEKKL